MPHPFYIFWHYDMVQNSHFLSDIRFSQYISTDNFFNTIQIFDMISDVNCVSLKGRCRFKNIALYSTCWHYVVSILRFTEEADVRKQALPFVPGRYVRTSDVISDVFCVLLRRMRRINKAFAFVLARCIRTWSFSEHERHHLGVSKLCEFHIKTSWVVFKNCTWKVPFQLIFGHCLVIEVSQ